jgi:UBX domain-containing protein 6
MGEDFYRLTPDDAKAMVATAAARREREGVLQTRAHREADAARRRRKYRKASIRVRFGDGTMLQATFAVSAPVSRILGLVSESLRQPGTEFELCPPRGRPLSEPSATIEAADLAPAALLTFRPAQPMEPPFLTQELLDQMTPLNAVAVSLPAGEGGISAAEPTHIHATVAQPRAPKGAPK